MNSTWKNTKFGKSELLAMIKFKLLDVLPVRMIAKLEKEDQLMGFGKSSTNKLFTFNSAAASGSLLIFKLNLTRKNLNNIQGQLMNNRIVDFTVHLITTSRNSSRCAIKLWLASSSKRMKNSHWRIIKSNAFSDNLLLVKFCIKKSSSSKLRIQSLTK